MKKNDNKNTENENSASFNEARAEMDAKTERGKNLITDIAMTCSNDYTVIDSLMEILELFSVQDAAVSIGDLSDNLQGCLFQWTKEYGNAMDAWKDSVLYGDKYKNTGGESPKTSDTAKQVSDLLNNPNTPTALKNGIKNGLDEIFNHELDDQTLLLKFEQSPEYIEKLLSLMSK